MIIKTVTVAILAATFAFPVGSDVSTASRASSTPHQELDAMIELTNEMNRRTDEELKKLDETIKRDEEILFQRENGIRNI